MITNYDSGISQLQRLWEKIKVQGGLIVYSVGCGDPASLSQPARG
ncbi:hypothetical protein PC116_g17996 [Phytophthora cactorum]|uniref:Uncharacterized protein n=1 Tax=Phytophthora cactorum TaxID=29920 RepID=A0A8T1CIW6_9STRA|nr:hypothetical protein Pcac1_g24132 [Phytophthora cactorum]KAG2891756.1 hypothetical protein PC114_g16890 [Phytophthora cactorum]KAG2922341.1 hypothetical protein PC117_g16001 [Phytophthora cactorum]KAG3002067.1 hypothetical protein PC119_g16477 [Phytophthora cactorum]KAG3007906.1 hypothetical protein PC120_g16560 [Phytophthora cactorum]